MAHWVWQLGREVPSGVGCGVQERAVERTEHFKRFQARKALADTRVGRNDLGNRVTRSPTGLTQGAEMRVSVGAGDVAVAEAVGQITC